MGRPRTFDEDRVLDAAMRLFWANGYEATSTRDLCEAVGLDRSSVYNAFTSKHELFRRALIRYVDARTAAHLEILGDERRPAAERIRALLARIVEDEDEVRRGCLTVNTTVELAGRDHEIARLLERDLERRLDALTHAIAAGQRAGDITSRREPAVLARYVNTVIAGMRVAGRGGADRESLEAVAAVAVDALTA